MKPREVNNLVFYCHTWLGRHVYLVITGNDTSKIIQLKHHLCKHFQTQDLGNLDNFLGIEVSQSKEGNCVGYLERNKNDWL